MTTRVYMCFECRTVQRDNKATGGRHPAGVCQHCGNKMVMTSDAIKAPKKNKKKEWAKLKKRFAA